MEDQEVKESERCFQVRGQESMISGITYYYSFINVLLLIINAFIQSELGCWSLMSK